MAWWIFDTLVKARAFANGNALAVEGAQRLSFRTVAAFDALLAALWVQRNVVAGAATAVAAYLKRLSSFAMNTFETKEERHKSLSDKTKGGQLSDGVSRNGRKATDGSCPKAYKLDRKKRREKKITNVEKKKNSLGGFPFFSLPLFKFLLRDQSN